MSADEGGCGRPFDMEAAMRCRERGVSPNNQNDFTGRVLGGTVEIENHFTMQRPVLVDGLGSIEGFNQNVVYIREVVD